MSPARHSPSAASSPRNERITAARGSARASTLAADCGLNRIASRMANPKWTAPNAIKAPQVLIMRYVKIAAPRPERARPAQRQLAIFKLADYTIRPGVRHLYLGVGNGHLACCPQLSPQRA